MTKQSDSAPQFATIVGGAGFIGRHLGAALARSNQNVTVLDVDKAVGESAHWCTCTYCDVRCYEDVRGAFDRTDTVYLLASLLMKQCDEDPSNGWRTNVEGTFHVLNELAQRPQPPRIVYFSSSMVYGADAALCPFSEATPLAGETLYAQTKRAGEQLIRSYCTAYGGKAIIVRPFSVYGPRGMLARKGHFLGRWLERLRAGAPLVIDGDGGQTVDLVHVDDVVEACLLAEKLELARGEVETFNVGSGQETKVRRIAQWIQEVMPNVRIEFAPAKQHVMGRRCADIRKAEKVLDYHPKVSPEAGVKRLFEMALEGGVLM